MKALVIKGAAGFGKTEKLLRRIASSVGRVWEYYAPTHKLADECAARLREMNPGLRIVVVKGRDHCPDGKTPMCKKQPQATALIEAGQSVFPLLCLRSAGKDKPAIKCEHYDQCPYIQQFKPADVYIYPHAYLTLESIVLEQRNPFGVVIDESPVLSSVETTTFPITLLTDPNIPKAAANLCDALADAIRYAPDTIREIVRSANLSGELVHAQNALNKVAAGIKPDMNVAQFNAALKTVKSFKPVSILLDNLGRSWSSRHAPQSVEFDHGKGMISVHHRKDILKRFDMSRPGEASTHGPKQMFFLDASASPLLMKQFVPEFKHIDIPMTRNAYVIQSSSNHCATSSLIAYKDSNKPNAKNATKKSKAAAKQRLKDIQHLLNRLSAEGRRVLVVGPASVVGNPRTQIKPVLKSPVGVELAHFNALRGIDRWKDCDTVVILGRNQPAVHEVERIARGMYFDAPTPLSLSGQWSIEKRGYRLKSGKAGVDVQVHVDPRVQAVVEQIRECESLQAIDRIRLIHNDQVKTVILLSNLPLDIDVDELRTWDEIIHGGNRLDLACKAHTGSVFPLNPAWLAETFAEIWPTAAAAKQDVGRILKKEQTSNMNTIRKMFPFDYQYKLARQRNWSRCLSRFPDETETAEELIKLLGALVTVRPKPTMVAVKKAA